MPTSRHTHESPKLRSKNVCTPCTQMRRQPSLPRTVSTPPSGGGRGAAGTAGGRGRVLMSCVASCVARGCFLPMGGNRNSTAARPAPRGPWPSPATKARRPLRRECGCAPRVGVLPRQRAPNPPPGENKKKAMGGIVCMAVFCSRWPFCGLTLANLATFRQYPI